MRVAINGFGRIGRLIFRIMDQDSDFEIVAINDLTDAEQLAYLLKYDTAHRPYKKEEISFDNDILIVGDKKIKVLSEKDPSLLPWKELDIDLVYECTGLFTSLEKANAHIEAGAKKVVISAPATGDIKTVVYNVNQDILDGTETVISGASCTTNCLAPMAKVLNDKYGVQKGFMTTIHAYTNDQNTLDAPHGKGDLRRGRAAAASIVPNSTGAAKAIGLVIPELNGKLDGGAQRVPVITGSLTELVCTLNTKVTAAEINEAMKAAANESFGYTEDEIVSADVIGISYGSLFDATQTKVMEVNGEQLVKVAAWYDNEMSYTNQLIRTLGYFASLIK